MLCHLSKISVSFNLLAKKVPGQALSVAGLAAVAMGVAAIGLDAHGEQKSPLTRLIINAVADEGTGPRGMW